MTATHKDTTPLMKELIALGETFESRLASLKRENNELRESLLDARAFHETRKDETFTSEFARQLILSEEHPLRLYREHRQLSQTLLSEKSGVSQAIISGIENKKRRGTVDNFKALAIALEVDIDSLVD